MEKYESSSVWAIVCPDVSYRSIRPAGTCYLAGNFSLMDLVWRGRVVMRSQTKWRWRSKLALASYAGHGEAHQPSLQTAVTHIVRDIGGCNLARNQFLAFYVSIVEKNEKFKFAVLERVASYTNSICNVQKILHDSP
jgi:hypothetical protein